MKPHPDKRAVDAQLVLSNFLRIGGKQRDFISLMAKESRFLQAEFTRLCMSWLERAALQYADGDYDINNEVECQKAYAICLHNKKEVS